MIGRKLLFLAALGIVFLTTNAQAAAIGTTVPVAGGKYTDVTASELKRMLGAKDFFFVNVHIPYAGEIAGTDAFVPYDQVREQLHLLPAKKNAKIVLYCMSDRMSTIAAKTLVELGYTNVWNLQGGMAGWDRQGYPVIRKSSK